MINIRLFRIRTDTPQDLYKRNRQIDSQFQHCRSKNNQVFITISRYPGVIESYICRTKFSELNRTLNTLPWFSIHFSAHLLSNGTEKLY